MKDYKILIVDDDKFFCEIKTALLKKNNYAVHSVHSADQALPSLKNDDFDLVLLDLKIGDAWGIDVLKQIKTSFPDTIVIMITALEDISIAVEAIRQGAYDYLQKDIGNEELLIKIKRALDKRSDLQKIKGLKDSLSEKFSYSNIVGKNTRMAEIYAVIKNICDTDVTVLVTGETGTGKELIAKAVHFNSPRKDNPFTPINCAAIGEHLMESELFGHEKGAFTDAYKQRIGKAEMADTGTLFLDEIGDMSLNLQAKVLRFLQDKSFERVGGNASISSDVRIIAATNKDLQKMIKEGSFREDLYYRLNVLHINVPPLRDRLDDLPDLVEHFIRRANIKFGRNIKSVSDKTMKQLLEYTWPGNIRELENVMDRLTLMENNDIIDVDFGDNAVPSPASAVAVEQTPAEGEGSFSFSNLDLPMRQARDEFEKIYFENLLKKHEGNINLVAEKSGMDRKSVFLKLRQHRLKKEEYKV